MRNGIFVDSKYLPTKYLVVTKNTEIRQIKHYAPQLFPFYVKAEIIYHIFSPQSVIGIAECSA